MDKNNKDIKVKNIDNTETKKIEESKKIKETKRNNLQANVMLEV